MFWNFEKPIDASHRRTVFSTPMTNNLYVLGGRQRKRVLKQDEEWTLYDKAIVLEVHAASGSGRICLEHDTPAVARSHDESSVLFKAGTIQGETLYACTSTEVMVYDLPKFKRTNYISLPCFNDLHHVRPTPDGNLLVVNTGLDMVVEVRLDGSVVRQWYVIEGDPWQRFSPVTDYRKVETTKPHLAHPNFVFRLEDEIWVTRAQQKDVICLTDSGRRITIGGVYIHDGHVHNGMIYFTSVDSRVIVVDQNSLQIEHIIDLNTIDNQRGSSLGWCRGLYMADERHAWVGFTRVRKTKFNENVNWVKHVGRDLTKPARISLYDIHARRCLVEIDVEQFGMNVVFSVLPAVASEVDMTDDSTPHAVLSA
jgi:hypothetical protein